MLFLGGALGAKIDFLDFIFGGPGPIIDFFHFFFGGGGLGPPIDNFNFLGGPGVPKWFFLIILLSFKHNCFKTSRRKEIWS